jgi:hypothetical protein
MTEKVKCASTGTPYGINTILELVTGCPKRAWFKAHMKDEVLDVDSNQLTGTIFHALLDCYYTTRETQDFDFVGDYTTLDIFDEAMLEALRLFDAYVAEYLPNELGHLLNTEEAIQIDDTKVVGTAPYTCSIDLVTKMSKGDVAVIKKTRGLDLEPGVYLTDHKTGRSVSPNSMMQYNYPLAQDTTEESAYERYQATTQELGRHVV